MSAALWAQAYGAALSVLGDVEGTRGPGSAPRPRTGRPVAALGVPRPAADSPEAARAILRPVWIPGLVRGPRRRQGPVAAVRGVSAAASRSGSNSAGGAS